MHHQHLLRSDDDEEVLLGICSVIYWGQYKPTKIGEKRNSATTFSAETLTPKIANTKPESAAKIVRKGITELDHKNYAQALIGVYDLLHCRLSLVSAMLAFIDPENVGIFDNRLTNLLLAMERNSVLEEIINPDLARPEIETLTEAAGRFAKYCIVLQQLKYLVNDNRTGWKDATNCQMSRFRSIDIQRALSVMHIEAGKTG